MHPRIRGLFSILILLLTACSTAQIRTSPNDDRAYEYFDLDNGMKVLLVSDPGADKSAASLAVFRGSFDDPKGRGGLAHFLEHMLFLGTEKYPETDGYQSFISTHGGTHNAYTAGDHTNYFFDIQPDFFAGALDQFAQFFIAPLFDAQYVEREKNAVNSEYQLYLKEDGWRGFHVAKQTMNPAHPGAEFTVGSLDTLGGDVRADLLQFYETHYSADQMALVMVARDDLDTLRTWATQMFSAVVRRAVSPPTALPALYEPSALPSQLSWKTIKESRQLTLNFPVPGLDAYYETKPGDYIANLLGHEGEGSLHALLKDRGWIESLGASAGRFDANNALVVVELQLTELGSAHQKEITALVFENIALVRARGLEQWRYQEQARVAELAFQFQEKQSAMRTAYALAPNLRLYPARDVLVAPYLMEGFDAALIGTYADALNPDNVLVEVANQTVDTDRVEPYFEVPYKLERIDSRSLTAAATATALALPPPNPFLPESLAMVEASDDQPKRVVDVPGLEVWLARDPSFGTPRANGFVAISVTDGLRSPSDLVHATLYARLVEDQLNTYAYPATLAGLSYALNANANGFRISISGFDDKQGELLDRVLLAFAQLKISEPRLALYQDELRRELQNFTAERPFQQAYAGVSHLLVSDSWPPKLLSEAVSTVTTASLAQWRAAHLSRVRATALLHGNVDEADGDRFASALREHLRIAAIAIPQPSVARVDAMLTMPIEAVSEDAAMALYIQGRTEDYAERARFGLAGHILGAPYFNELRTERQLGYVVSAAPAVLRRTPGLAFLVQSPVADTGTLVDTTIDFLTRYRATLAAMPAAEFDAHKQGLLTKLLEKDKNLAARSGRYWSDLDLGFTDFDSRERIANEIRAIDQAAFTTFFDVLVARSRSERLVVFSAGRFEVAPDGDRIDDVPTFKLNAHIQE